MEVLIGNDDRYFSVDDGAGRSYIATSHHQAGCSKNKRGKITHNFSAQITCQPREERVGFETARVIPFIQSHASLLSIRQAITYDVVY